MNIIVSKNVVFWRGGWCFRHVCSFIGLSWTERFVCVELCLFSLECCLYLLIYTCNSLDYIVACGKQLSVVHGACSLLPTAHRIHLNPTGLNSLLRLYIMRIDKSTLFRFRSAPSSLTRRYIVSYIWRWHQGYANGATVLICLSKSVPN